MRSPRRKTALWAGLVLVIACSSQVGAQTQVQGQIPASPPAISQLTLKELGAVPLPGSAPSPWPQIKGQATLSCIASALGDLYNCTVASESPRGAGLGDAALSLAASTKVAPKMSGGKAVASEVKVPFQFPHAPPPPLIRAPAPLNPPPGTGVARLRCTASPGGELSDCSVLAESPAGVGVGDAALKSVPSVSPLPGTPKDGGVIEANFSVALTPDQLAKVRTQPAVYGRADWATRPTGAQMSAVYPTRALEAGIGGSATLHCQVAGTGYVTDCVVVTEMPRGQGFGVAALGLAHLFRMKPKTENNIPIAGTVTIPITFSPPVEPSGGDSSQMCMLTFCLSRRGASSLATSP